MRHECLYHICRMRAVSGDHDGRLRVGIIEQEFNRITGFVGAHVDIVGDKVFLRYTRQWPIMCGKGKAEITGDGAMRIYPLKWFYE